MGRIEAHVQLSTVQSARTSLEKGSVMINMAVQHSAPGPLQSYDHEEPELQRQQRAGGGPGRISDLANRPLIMQTSAQQVDAELAPPSMVELVASTPSSPLRAPAAILKSSTDPKFTEARGRVTYHSEFTNMGCDGNTVVAQPDAAPCGCSRNFAQARADAEIQESRERLERMGQFRTEDYDVAESDLHRELILNTSQPQYTAEQAWSWFLSFLIGIVNGVVGFIFNWGIEVLTDVRFRTTKQYITEGGGFAIPYLINIAFVVLYATAAGLLGSYLSPLASGSGIPEIRVYLNGLHVKGLLTIRTLIAKSAGVMFSIACGLYAGKEGPFIHVGAVLGGGVSGMGSQSLTRCAAYTHELQRSLQRALEGPGLPPRCLWVRVTHCQLLIQRLARPNNNSVAIAACLFMPWLLCAGVVGALVLITGTMYWTNGAFRAKLRRTFGGFFRTPVDHRDYVASGAAAGVATAFGAPIGGILFAVEEGSSHYSINMLWHAFVASGTALYVLLLLTSARDAEGSFWASRFEAPTELASPGSVLPCQRFWYYSFDLPVFCAMGVAGGLAGALLVYVNNAITAVRHKYVPKSRPARRTLEVVAVAVVTATLWFGLSFGGPCSPLPAAGRPPPSIGGAGDGRGMAPPPSPDAPLAPRRTTIPGTNINSISADAEASSLYPPFPQLWCPEGQYSTFGTLFFVPIGKALTLLLQYEGINGEQLLLDIPVLIAFTVLGFFVMCFTFGIGAATGMFIPSLVTGGAFGRLVGRLIRLIVKKTRNDDSILVPIQSYAVVGAAAMLGGTTRMLLSITVLILETTSAMSLTAPLVMATFFAKVTSDALCPGLFDSQIRRVGYPYLAQRARLLPDLKLQHQLTLADVMTTNVFTLPCVLRIRDLIDTLRAHKYSVFPLTCVPLADPGIPGPAAGTGTPSSCWPPSEPTALPATPLEAAVHASSGTRPADARAVDPAATLREKPPRPPAPPSGPATSPQTAGGKSGRPGMVGAGAAGFEAAAAPELHARPAFPLPGLGAGASGEDADTGCAATPRTGESRDTSWVWDGQRDLEATVDRLPGGIIGVVSRETILKMLEYRLGFFALPHMAHGSTLAATRVREMIRQLDQYPLKSPDTREGQERLFCGLNEAELEQYIDLQHYMQRVPYVLPAAASVSRAYHLFRSLGLHHIFVTPSSVPIAGLLTRRQLTLEYSRVTMHDKQLRQQWQQAAAVAPYHGGKRGLGVETPGPHDDGTSSGSDGCDRGGARNMHGTGTSETASGTHNGSWWDRAKAVSVRRGWRWMRVPTVALAHTGIGGRSSRRRTELGSAVGRGQCQAEGGGGEPRLLVQAGLRPTNSQLAGNFSVAFAAAAHLVGDVQRWRCRVVRQTPQTPPPPKVEQRSVGGAGAALPILNEGPPPGLIPGSSLQASTSGAGSIVSSSVAMRSGLLHEGRMGVCSLASARSAQGPGEVDGMATALEPLAPPPHQQLPSLPQHSSFERLSLPSPGGVSSAQGLRQRLRAVQAVQGTPPGTPRSVEELVSRSFPILRAYAVSSGDPGGGPPGTGGAINSSTTRGVLSNVTPLLCMQPQLPDPLSRHHPEHSMPSCTVSACGQGAGRPAGLVNAQAGATAGSPGPSFEAERGDIESGEELRLRPSGI